MNDFVTMIFAILGVVFVIYSVEFRVLRWKQEKIHIVIPLYDADDNIYHTVDNIRLFTELCGIQKLCYVTVVNYGVPEWFCEKLRFHYRGYGCFAVVNETEATKAICTKGRDDVG